VLVIFQSAQLVVGTDFDWLVISVPVRPESRIVIFIYFLFRSSSL
jgi:hypothetical protein